MAKRVCKLEGCGQPHCARGWCRKHYKRVRKHGDPHAVKYASGPNHPQWKGGGYFAAHFRVKARRGPAKDYPCAGCEGRAEEWSLLHDAEDTRVSRAGRYWCRFSDHPSDYRPLCVPCHRSYDRESACA